jgi:hypothetical protein
MVSCILDKISADGARRFWQHRRKDKSSVCLHMGIDDLKIKF